MSKFAQVRGGVVVYVIEAGNSPGGDWVECAGLHVGPGYTYNGSAFAAPVVVYKKIRAEAFWERFTNGELVAYDVAMQHDPAANNSAKNAAAKLRIFQRDTDTSGYRKLTANKVVNAVNDLEAAGILASGRAAAILTTPITADEAYIDGK